MSTRIQRAAIAIATAAAATKALAIGINEQRFEALGGRLDEPLSFLHLVQTPLERESLQPRFRNVGQLRFPGTDRDCTATWLGEDEQHAFVMTAAHCVASDFRHAPWARSLGPVTLSSRLPSRHEGRGLAFIPMPRPSQDGDAVEQDGSASDSDLAILRLPRRTARPLASETPPLLDDLDDDPVASAHPVGAVTEFVGYGAWHVGTRSIDRAGRLWARAPGRATGRARQRFTVGYQPTGDTDRWFTLTSGDSGGAFWQARWGYWHVVATASARDKGWRGSEGPRMAALVHWVKGVFPGIRTLSDRLSVGAGAPFVSRDHSEDVSSGTVVYLVPAQAGATGPAEPATSGASGYSVIQAVVEDELTRHRAEIRLRGQRETGCGWASRMEDDTTCGERRGARLTVSFHAEDNPGLMRGSYVGQIEIEAVGTSDGRYRERFPLRLRIGHLTAGTVTASRGYESPDLAGLLSAQDGSPVRVALPVQARAHRDGEASGGVQPSSRVIVTVRDVLEGRDRTLVLRAFRRPATAGACAPMPMAATVDCEGRRLPRVSLQFVEGDNPGLPAGLYRGRVFLEARGGPGGTRRELIGVGLNVDTL